MSYPSFLKRIALRAPVLGSVVLERDRLRGDVSAFTGKCEVLEGKLRSLEALEKKLESLESENLGYCHCCRQNTNFKITGDWLRDQYLCVICGSIPRQRHIQHILDRCFSGWEGTAVHESSPSNTLISRYCDDYSSSQYFSGIKSGDFFDGVRCENLEALTFEDGTFDLFITQDVFEHIFNPDRAAKEIMRVLKPGGAHVFTAPKHKGISKSYQRAKLVGAEVEHIHEPSYHGNPIGDGRALVTWDYGDDFEFLVNEWSGSFTVTYITRDRALGLDGEYLEVFVTYKGLK